MIYPCLMTKANSHHTDVVVLFLSECEGVIVNQTSQPVGKPPHEGTAGRLGYKSDHWTEATNTSSWKPATLDMVSDKTQLKNYPELLI